MLNSLWLSGNSTNIMEDFVPFEISPLELNIRFALDCSVGFYLFAFNSIIVGVNGAGKTTTFDILTGLSFSSAGCAVVNGMDVIDSPAIGYCPQFDALPLDLTGREVLL